MKFFLLLVPLFFFEQLRYKTWRNINHRHSASCANDIGFAVTQPTDHIGFHHCLSRPTRLECYWFSLQSMADILTHFFRFVSEKTRRSRKNISQDRRCLNVIVAQTSSPPLFSYQLSAISHIH